MDFSIIIQRLNELTTFMNNVRTLSKKIFQLPPSTEGIKWVAAYNDTSQETEKFNLTDALNEMYSLTNGITAIGNIVRDGADFTFEVGFEWKINGIEYANAEITRTINDAGTGNHRIDIAVCDTNDDIYIIEGFEVGLATAVVQPPTPPNTLFICSFLITESVIGDNSNPGLTIQNNIPLKIEILSTDLPTDDINGFVEYFNELNPPLTISETTSLVQFFCTDTEKIYQLTGVGKGVYGLSSTQITSANVILFVTSGGVGNVPTLDQVLGEGGRLVRFTPNDGADAVFVLEDRQKVVLKRGSGDFFLNSGIFSVGDELIFEAILDGWGGGVSFGTDPIFVNGVDVSNDALPIQSNQRGYLFLSEIVSGVEYWIYRVIGDIIQDNVFMLRSNNGSDIINIATFRANLGVDKITNRGDANYTILSTDKAVATNANFTAPRTFTLPLANSVNAGYEIIVADLFGGVSPTNTLTISRNGSDTINGANTVVIGAQYGMRRLFSDGVSKWTFDGGVMRISDYIGTTLTPSVIVATDVNSKLQPLPTSTYPSLAELAYVKGVTSAIQTQLNNRTLNIVKRATASSPVTGTAVESILTTDEIVGNTFSTNDILQLVSARFIKTGALGTCTYRIRINTTNSLSGAVTIATLNNAGIYAKIGNRTFTITGGNIRGYNFTDNGISSGQDTGSASLAEASTAYNPANSIFIFTTAQLANGGDSTICREFLITN